jgi:hypothetical protein
MHAAVRQFDVGEGRGVGLAGQQLCGQAASLKVPVNGLQPLGAFGVARAHFVQLAVGMGEITCFIHSGALVSFFSDNVVPWMHNRKSSRC